MSIDILTNSINKLLERKDKTKEVQHEEKERMSKRIGGELTEEVYGVITTMTLSEAYAYANAISRYASSDLKSLPPGTTIEPSERLILNEQTATNLDVVKDIYNLLRKHEDAVPSNYIKEYLGLTTSANNRKNLIGLLSNHELRINERSMKNSVTELQGMEFSSEVQEKLMEYIGNCNMVEIGGILINVGDALTPQKSLYRH